MQRLVEEVTAGDFQRAHPILQASYAHYALVVVHPFADGNGRVARAVASAYLLRAARVPLLVFADERDDYLDALSGADSGDRESFVAFCAGAAIGAVAVVISSLLAAKAPSPEDAVAEFETIAVALSPGSHKRS